jgi:hypothetical protein
MNNKQEFLALVEAGKPPGVSQTNLDKAKRYYIEWNLLDRRVPRECARECIDLARRFDSSAAALAAQLDSGVFQHLHMTPQDLMMSDDLAEKIRPAVEKVRSELFSSPHPPFAALEEAIQWLERTAAEQETQARANNQSPEALKQTIYEMLEKYRLLTGEPVDNPFQLELLEYVEPGNQWVRCMPVRWGMSLATLAMVSKELAGATGFSQASVVAYILAGIRPLLVPISISMLWGYSNTFSIFRRRTTVELHTPNITDTQLKAIRKVIRREWSTERKKPLTEADKQLLDVVHRLGGVPKDKRHGEYKAFFEHVRQEFNTWAVAHGCRQHSKWVVTRLKHKRLLEKLSMRTGSTTLRRSSIYDAYL